MIFRLPRLAARYLFRRAERRRAGGYWAMAHRDYARAARAGYTPAQHRLALAYQSGQGCVRSGALAVHWHRAAAERGHVDSQFELGLILLNARDLHWAAGPSAAWLRSHDGGDQSLAATLFPQSAETDRDPAEAFRWLTKAAEAGRPEAQANVGWLRLKGVGCDVDRAEADRWLTAAAAHDVSQAALGLAEYYRDSTAPDCDLGASAQWAERASRLGNGSGSWHYALALRDGVGVAQDLAAAERYFDLAAEQGHPTAAYDGAKLTLAREPNLEVLQAVIERLRHCGKRKHVPSALLLADLYGRDDRMRPNLREVAHWYQVAAELGHPEAQFMMGCFYARGDGVVCDLKHAARYFDLAANAGHVHAAFNLGVFYLAGQGVIRDVDKAERWLFIAAEAGLAPAQLRLGQILEQKAKTPAQIESARSFIESAAHRGSTEAKLSLARLLFSDQTETSELQAICLLREAMELGDVEACRLLLPKSSGRDLEIVVATLQSAIKLGNTRAKVVLAEGMLTNKQLQPDMPKAISLLEEAIAAGDAQAHFLIGVVYCQGTHVEKDLGRGFANYIAAANLGHPLAQYNTGIMLLQGVGTEKSTEDAVVWIRRAASSNVQKAIEFMHDVEQRALSSELNS